jgi:Na+-driven multidrug efflux pump
MKTKYYLITVIIVMFAFFTFLITYFLSGCHNTKASHYEPIARPTT